VIQAFARETYSQKNLIRAPNLFLEFSLDSFLFCLFSILDLSVHSAIDIFNFRVDPAQESLTKAGPSMYKCGYSTQKSFFWKDKNIRKGILDGCF